MKEEKSKKEPSAQSAKDAYRMRVAEQLRENLKRRKSQQRARNTNISKPPAPQA